MSWRQLTEGRGCDRPSLRVEPRGQRVEVKRCHPLSVSSLTRRGAEALPGSLLIEFQMGQNAPGFDGGEPGNVTERVDNAIRPTVWISIIYLISI